MPYRNILWIKLEKRLLNDYRFYTMSENAQLIFVKLLLLAAETDNKLPKTPSILKTCLRSNLSEKSLEACIKEIRTHLPKFKESSEFYYFYEWKNRINRISPREFPGSPRGVPKDALDKEKIRQDKIRKDKSISTGQEPVGKTINDFIDSFKEINPSYEQLFKRPNQRAACERLLKKHGPEKIAQVMTLLPKTNTMQYAPVITTPLQLEEKLGRIIAFISKEKIKADSKEVRVARI